MVPLHGFLQGDTLGLILLADEGETVGSLAKKLQRAAAVRVKPQLDARLRILYRGRVLDPTQTVAAAGLEPLDRIDVAVEDP